MNKYRLDQKGAVSLISVALFAILITVITTLYMRTVSSQQRNALDYDMKTRAFYASLVGFEDTKRAIDDGDITENKEQCAPDDSSQTALSAINLKYTCQLVEFRATTLEHTAIDPDVEARFFPLAPSGTFTGASDYTLNISWSGNDTTARTGEGSKLLPPVSGWDDHPPMLRAQIIKTNQDLDRDSMTSQSYFFNPETSISKPSLNFSESNWAPSGQSLRAASCSSGICTAEVSLRNLDFSEHRAFLVVKAVYRQINSVTVQLENAGSEPLPLTGQAFIDITGRAGDVFRRTRQGIGVGRIPVSTAGFPDFSIVGGDGICKNMSLTNDSDSFRPNSC